MEEGERERGVGAWVGSSDGSRSRRPHIFSYDQSWFGGSTRIRLEGRQWKDPRPPEPARGNTHAGAGPGMVYRDFHAPVLPDQAALQFYNEEGEVVWTAPSMPTVVQLK